MISPSIISLILILISNLPNEILTKRFKTAYFEIIQKDRNLPTYSSNLIKLFQSDQSSCLLACNLNFLCNVAIFNLNGWCALCQKEALNELIDSINTTVFINENPISPIKNGLINYWPIVNDLRDYIGSSDMSPGALDASESIGFTRDRFKTINGAIYMNPGYYTIPPGVYFNNSFSFLVWVKAFKFAPYSRIIDFGNGQQDNVFVSLSYSYNYRMYIALYRGYNILNITEAPNQMPTNTWFHLATIYDGQNLMLYVNGSLIANSTSDGPTDLFRTNCYIGRSNWHDVNGDSDAYACYDDLMIYNRALSLDEVQNCMKTSFN